MARPAGRLAGIGVGPGDPELLTLKAVRLIRRAHVVAYPSARHGRSIARTIAAAHIAPGQTELPLVFPVTGEAARHTAAYESALAAFYDETAAAVAAHLEAGRDVAVLCEGDPFFYGSFMYLYERLAGRFPTEVVPGVTSVSAAAARAGTPLAQHDETLVVVPGTLPAAELAARLQGAQAAAVLKLGRNFRKVRAALEAAGLAARARYVERATTAAERLLPMAEVDPETVPYFSLALVPGGAAAAAPAAGSLAVVGLGPGAPEWLSTEAARALAGATDLVGYGPYLARVQERPGQRRHASDNREEGARARLALELAAAGRAVAAVSSGDPGIFAMATVVMEAMEGGPPAWREVPVTVVPGISAMQAAAARVGAPLGHDFCVISLSDQLKPWAVVARRLEAAAGADLALALYNPASAARTWQLAEATAILARHRAPTTPVVVARDVGGPEERVAVVDLASLDPATVDMRTVVLVGASTTRAFRRPDGRDVVYTPRRYPAGPEGPAP